MLFLVKKEQKFLYLHIPSIIIQLFVILIYLEILELNFCGLNKNTRRNIHLRGASEIDQRETISEDNKSNIVIKKVNIYIYYYFEI